MANNHSIQLLRGNNISESAEVLLPGQPAFDMAENKLYIGKDPAVAINQLVPISGGTDVPVASETQFGTIKCWVDSAGYLCISTE